MDLLKLITPLNLAEEEKKFFSSPTYHPQFAYALDRDEIGTWLLESPKYVPLTTAILKQDENLITSLAHELFQVPWTNSLLDEAKQIVNKFPRKQRIPSNAMKETFKELIQVIRYENGVFNHIKHSANYLPTEEGLATFIEDHQSPSARFQHAAEYAVTAITRKGSLRDAIDYLISIGFPKRLAWQRAVKHKFGFVDTAKPGDIMKPAMYFAYSQQVNKLTLNERIRLFVGKIALDDLKKYPKYKGKWSEEQVKEFFFQS